VVRGRRGFNSSPTMGGAGEGLGVEDRKSRDPINIGGGAQAQQNSWSGHRTSRGRGNGKGRGTQKVGRRPSGRGGGG